ncbi:MAG: TetR/AcrR family transcriptional regulator [Myxococcota bacterium]|nr:TetR/AcrR family transcriptional regulator [Myxococcota bacterium]
MEKPSGAVQKRAIKQDRAVQTRKGILEAAIKLFARKGLLATTMADLAKAISMTPGALYWHFPTKEDLVLGALEELEARYKDAWKDLITEGRTMTAAEQMRGFFQRTHSFVRENPQYGMFMCLLSSEAVELSDRVATALRGTIDVFAHTLTGIIRYGQVKTGEFRKDVDARTLAQALLASHMGTVIFSNLFAPEASYDAMFLTLEKVTAPGMEPKHAG